jgi:prepilin-type N-terminal cleavage/methylation domain-containing protein
MKFQIGTKIMKKGFTLVELLVGASIIVVVFSTTSYYFLRGTTMQRRILDQRQVLDSLSYVLEYTTSQLRLAKRDDVAIEFPGIGSQTKNCLPTKNEGNFEVSGNSILFRNYKNQCQRIYLDGGRIKVSFDGGSSLDLTPSYVEVQSLQFVVRGDEVSPVRDNLQPRVTVSIKAQKKGRPETQITVQTTVSQRDLDY